MHLNEAGDGGNLEELMGWNEYPPPILRPTFNMIFNYIQK